LNELLSKVCVLVQQAFEVSQVSVLLKDEDELVMRAKDGRLTACISEGGRLPAADGPWGRALENAKTIVENDAASHSSSRLYVESSSQMCIPLVSFGQALGVLVLDSNKKNTFNANDIQPLESVADICATAIQNAHYVDRVKQLAYLDGLTGIFNRRFFEVRIAEEMERARRLQSGLGILMIDIDHFKRLNDEFGHLLGDEVLRQVSSIFHQQVRKIDVVCRYGGEEFAILLSQTTPQHSLAIADKLRRIVETWQFPGVARPVTISAGAANYPEHGLTRDDLVQAADAGLYAAKQAGRNRVCLAPDVPRSRAHGSGR